MKGYGQSPLTPGGAALLETFVRMWEALATVADTDDDGEITAAELKQAFRDFYLSPDVNAPGKHLFGD